MSTPDPVAELIAKLADLYPAAEAAEEIATNPDAPAEARAAAWRTVGNLLDQGATIAAEAADILDPSSRYWSHGCGAEVLRKDAELLAADCAKAEAEADSR